MFLKFKNIVFYFIYYFFSMLISVCFFIVALTFANACLINVSDYFICLNIFFALFALILA